VKLTDIMQDYKYHDRMAKLRCIEHFRSGCTKLSYQ